MVDIREFIRNLGDGAPAYFDVKPETIKRWVRTGNVPIKVAQKIFAAHDAIQKSVPVEPVRPPSEPVLDPMTHLPVNMDKRLPVIQPIGGRLPETIEISPTEQSFGNNFTRPSRVPQPHPMKLKDDGSGNKVPFQENTPALADQKNPDGSPKAVPLPPSIGGNWTEKKDEHATAPATAEGVSQSQV